MATATAPIGITVDHDEVVEWRNSEARDVLYGLILDGIIPSDMKPKEVYTTYLKHLPAFAPYQNYKALQFAGKLASTRKRATAKVDRAAEDLRFFEHDREIFPAPTSSSFVMAYRRSNTNDLPLILDLQRQNLPKNIVNEKELKEQGFVTAEHDLPLLTKMSETYGHTVAMTTAENHHDDGKGKYDENSSEIAGYVLTMTKECRSLLPETLRSFF